MRSLSLGTAPSDRGGSCLLLHGDLWGVVYWLELPLCTMFPFLPTLHSLLKYNTCSIPYTNIIIQTNKTVFLPTYIHTQCRTSTCTWDRTAIYWLELSFCTFPFLPLFTLSTNTIHAVLPIQIIIIRTKKTVFLPTNICNGSSPRSRSCTVRDIQFSIVVLDTRRQRLLIQRNEGELLYKPGV